MCSALRRELTPQRRTHHRIYLIKYSTCFGKIYCPSSGVSQHCIQAIGICHASSVDCQLAWSGPDHASRRRQN